MSIVEKLLSVQTELKAPKGQYNSFGKYKYRSCEDILEAVKPILAKYKASITVSDDLVQIGNRIYVKATARFLDAEVAGISIDNTAFAREPDTKKGMDESQITGTASSYARKYALNGLLLIDDTKDADTEAYQQQQQPRKTAQRRTTTTAPRAAAPATNPRYTAIEKALKECTDIDQLIDLYEQHKNEVEANPDIKSLFSERKRALRVITF
jgi:hypothetical protein